MSNSSGIVSFDLRRGEGSLIDVASMMPLSEVHSYDHTHGRNILDDIQRWRRTIDLVVPMKIELERFQTFPTLDLATETVRNYTNDVPTRKKLVISAIAPLYIPYGSMDVRKFQKYKSTKTYPDLYKRTLPYGLMMRRAAKWTVHLVKSHKRPIYMTFGAFLVASIPLLFFVKLSVEAGYQELLSIPQATGALEVRHHIKSARGHFERSRVVFMPFSWIPLEQIQVAKWALLGGLSLTRAIDTIGTTLPEWIDMRSALPRSREIIPSFRSEARDFFFLSYIGIESPTAWLEENKESLQLAYNYLRQAATSYQNTSGQDSRIELLQNVGGGLESITNILAFYLANEQDILWLLGHDDPKRYIIFNQNRDEIRANGGFPGSVFTFTLYKWNILDYRQDDVYYYDWNLYPYKEIPPPGISLLTENYGLRDVNYYPDFRETLEKANSFVERSGDSTITTGIAIHQWIIEDILEKIWPVRVSGVSEPFTSENFSALMSTLVELEYGRQNHAKDILFDFVDAFVAKINETRSYGAVFESLEDSWARWQILMASRDDATDAFLKQFRPSLPWECDPLTDAMCSSNWVYPIFTSVSGNKSDRYIERTYRGTATKILGCKYENVLTLTQEHTFGDEDKKQIEWYMDMTMTEDDVIRDKELFIQWDGKNKAFVRLYVPADAELTFTGSDINIERQKNATIFSFNIETPAWATTSKTLRYLTNVPDCDNYGGDIDWVIQPWLRKVFVK
jgi:hypothetical protein